LPVVQEADALLEWQFWVKKGFPEFRRNHMHVDIVGLMEALVRERAKYGAYPILRDLCSVGLTLPVSNAMVEDAFSTLKIVKDYLSNALDDDTLDDKLQIKLNGPPEMPVCTCFTHVLIFLCTCFYICARV
jgi:hypothetical protein